MAGKRAYEAVLAIGAELQSSFFSVFKSAEKQIDTLKGGLKGFEAGVAGVFKGIGGLVTSTTAQIAGVAGGAGILALGTHAIGLAADMEQIEIAMSTHLGSLEKARNLIGDIQKFAVKSPFAFEDLASSAKSMLAFGFSSETVVDNLRMLGDVASGLGRPIDEIVHTFGIIKAQGRAFGKDVNALAAKGVPIFESLGKTMGVDADEIRGLVKEGSVGLPEVEKAFQMLTAEGGKFFGMSKAQSESFKGQMEGIRDNTSDLFRAIGAPIVDVLKPYLDAINESDIWDNMKTAIEAKVRPAIEGLAQALKGDVGQAVIKLGEDFMNFVSKVGTEIGKLFGGLTEGGELDVFKTMENVILTVAGAFAFLGEHANKIVPIITALGVAFAGLQIVGIIAALANPIGLVTIAITALISGVGLLIAHWGTVTEVIGKGVMAIYKGLQQVGKGVVDFLLAPVRNVITTWNLLAGKIPGMGGAKIPEIPLFSQETVKATEDVASALPGVESEAGKVDDAAKNVATAFQSWTLPGGLMSDLNALETKVGNVQRAMSTASIPGAQYGGIFRSPAIRQIGEAGPEAVIPMTPSARSRGLLSAAASAINPGGAMGAGNTQMTFNPTITINGNADKDTVSQMETSLRGIADDFLNRLNRAQDQERRLSFAS